MNSLGLTKKYLMNIMSEHSDYLSRALFSEVNAHSTRTRTRILCYDENLAVVCFGWSNDNVWR